ncbi:MAG TPA: hypothetical protein VF153_03905 [Candidatus Limnocylindria bacterium]
MIAHPIKDRSGRFGIRGFSPFGSDRVGAALARRLDDRHHYFRHVSPAGMPPIEAVVVGPGGAWTLLRASQPGRFRKRNGHWYAWNRTTESWMPWDAKPIDEARLAGHRLELYLERAALPTVVVACLLTDPGSEVSWERDQVPGISVEPDLEKLASRMDRDEVLTPAQVDRIVALLDPRQPLPRLATSTPQG